MTSLGDRLRRQRIQNRIGLEKVSLETKIGVRLLEAMEAGQFEKLPGGVFRRSFVLQYARALGIDPDEIAGEIKQLNDFDDVPAVPTADMIRGYEPPSKPALPFSIDFSGMGGSTLGSLLASVGVIMACALIYSWWQTPRTVARQEIAAAQKSEPVAPAAVAAPEPAAPAPAETPKAAEITTGDTAPVVVGLSADEQTWISISSDGKNVFSSALHAHETKIVEASEKIRILTGNAGGLEISLNGKSIGPIGPRGQVRVVELTPGGFQIVMKKPNLEPL